MDSDSEETYIAAAERQAKQNYLRETVVEAGYDPSIFVEYCEGLRGTDVDLWQFDELKECVADFQRKYQSLLAGTPKPKSEPRQPNLRQSLILSPQDLIDDSTPDLIDFSKEVSSGPQPAESLAVVPQPVTEAKLDHTENLYDIPCRPLMPTELSRSEAVSIEVSQ
jgi:hypothetical protein